MKIIMVVTRDYLMDEYIMAASENKDELIYLYIGKQLKNYSFCNSIYYYPFFDGEKIADYISNNILDVDYIFTCEEKLVQFLPTISENTHIKTYNNYNAMIARSKFYGKQKQRQDIVPKSLFFSQASEVDIENIENSFDYPIIIKPNYSYGSEGVNLVYNEKELKHKLSNIARINYLLKIREGEIDSSLNGIIVEEFLEGEEYAIDLLWDSGEIVFSGIIKRRHHTGTTTFPDYIYYTKKFPVQLETELIAIAKEYNDRLNIYHGATHTELICDKRSGLVKVIDNAIRPGGGGELFRLYNKLYEINLFSTYYNLMTGRKAKIEKNWNSRDCIEFLYIYIHEDEGIVENIYFDDKKIPRNTTIYTKDIFIELGDKILGIEYRNPPSIILLGNSNADENIFLKEIDKLNEYCNVVLSKC